MYPLPAQERSGNPRSALTISRARRCPLPSASLAPTPAEQQTPKNLSWRHAPQQVPPREAAPMSMWLKDPLAVHAGGDAGGGIVIEGTKIQIGRASCRERGEMAAVEECC